jgi:hypothetical protein
MARKLIDVGVKGNDGTGDPIREAFRKINDNFQELYTSLGLVQGFAFTTLTDTPGNYFGNARSVVSVANDENRLIFKRLIAGSGITIDTSNENEFTFNANFADIVADTSPQLGGDLSARSGGNQFRILDLGTDQSPLIPLSKHEAVNKAYADSKISLAGIDHLELTGNIVDGQPELVNRPDYGKMTGPLVLSRNPITEDDDLWDGLTAATKRYVDTASYYSRINLHVSTFGDDYREDIPEDKKGRALAYAYKTVEAAVTKAEELILDSPFELGPYAKVLTYNGGQQFSTLTSITPSIDSGSGCVAVPVMSVNTFQLVIGGTGYQAGDFVTLAGGTQTSPGVFRVVEINPTTGTILEAELLQSGRYTVIPGANNLSTTTSSTFGNGATFNVTYRVSAVNIVNPGVNYGLASLRILGGGGSGAFGFVDIVNGGVVSATITEQGSGYTSSPEIRVELPTFRIDTGGLGTDFTNDPGPSRDIREGLFLRGETSKALANILRHDGTLDGEDELFDVDIISGSFIEGERIAYGDPVKNLQITIFVETGIFEENLPLKVPPNVSIKGDEFRRSIIRPKSQRSSSPYSQIFFRRDTEIDGLAAAMQPFGYHYLTDSTEPVTDYVNNKGGYRSAKAILVSNKKFIQEEVVGWVDDQVIKGINPFSSNFVYEKSTIRSMVGQLVDALTFDLRWGGQFRTVSASLKNYELQDAAFLLENNLNEIIGIIDRIKFLCNVCLDNLPPGVTFSEVAQTIDPAFQAEINSDTSMNLLFDVYQKIVLDIDSINRPKENGLLDVFLMNDATILRNITVQSHGGFAMLLDPEGQILTKSPYAQVGSVLSASTGFHRLAGGLFIDGFAGNLEFTVFSKDSDFILNVGNLERRPQTPCSFLVDGATYRVSYIRNYIFNPNGSTCTFVLDEATPFSLPIFQYNQDICFRDVGLILEGVGYDLVLGTNYNSRKSGLVYLEANASVVVDDQLEITLAGINYAHEQAKIVVGNNQDAVDAIENHRVVIVDIIENGAGVAPAINFTSPPGLSVATSNAKNLILLNIDFIKDETIAYIDAQIASNTSPFDNGFTYDPVTYRKDFEYILHAVTYDLVYDGNSQSRNEGLRFYDGVGDLQTLQISESQRLAYISAITYAKNVTKLVILNQSPTPTFTLTPRVSGTPSDAVNADTLEILFSYIINVLDQGVSGAPSVEYPALDAYEYDPDSIIARNSIVSNTVKIQNKTVRQINRLLGYQTVTAGNRSMLSNDFTQINDMGYGILATNGGLTEAVGMFTYYCYTAFYALNGGQIRSVGGSSAYGVFGLKAEGSDPLEVPVPVTLGDDVVQGATVYSQPGFENVESGLEVWVTNYEYVPYNLCELEVNHSGDIAIYSITNVESTSSALPPGVIKLNISASTQGDLFSGRLIAAIPNGTPVGIRLSGTLRLVDVGSTFTTLPSTALILDDTPNIVYRVTALQTLDPGEALATLKDPYVYIKAKVFTTQPTGYGGIGNTKIAIGNLPTEDGLRLFGREFVWNGTVHEISNYKSTDETNEPYAELEFLAPLTAPVTGFSVQPDLYCGASAGLEGDITVKISTARFTGHDLLDIGTGSYADSNYPGLIFGGPVNPRIESNEVKEVGKGRVFAVTTDQNGTFKVGEFFTVNQGLGSVSLSADLVLNRLSGIGFKKGVSISEFSVDDTMGDNSQDAVPTEETVRSYIDRRLGVTHTGATITTSRLIPIQANPLLNKSGFLALSGQLSMKGNLDMGVNYRVTNLSNPVSGQDAVTKSWTLLSNLQDGELTDTENEDFLMLTGTLGSFVNVSTNKTTITNTPTARSGGSDVTTVRNENTVTIKLVGGQGSNNPITDFHINNDAEVQQSKLLMQLATTRSAAPTGTARQKQATTGLASFKDNEFTVVDGFVRIQTSTSNATGVPPTALQWQNGFTVLGNRLQSEGAVTVVNMTDVVDIGGSIKKNQYNSIGYLKRTGVSNTGDSDYTVVNDDVENTANTLVRRDGDGGFKAGVVRVTSLEVDGISVLDTVPTVEAVNTGFVSLKGYRSQGGVSIGDGATAASKVTFYDNTLHYFRDLSGSVGGTVRLSTLTSGGVGTQGTLIGNWSMDSTTNLTLGTGTIDASTGTLKSLTLTTGAAGVQGSITGSWILQGASSFTLQSGGKIVCSAGTLQSTTLDAGAAGTVSSIRGEWSLTDGSSLSPGLGTITATRSTNATLDNVEDATSTHYVTFVSSTTGDTPIRTDSGITYRPDLNRLSCALFLGNVTGNLTGNADTVTNGVYTVGNQTITGIKTFRNSTAVRVENSSTQDAIILAGRAGGTGSFAVTVTPGVLTASRTLTLADSNTVLVGGTMVTTAATDQTIAGVKTFSSAIQGDLNGNASTVTNGVYTVGNQTIGGTKTFSSTISGSINGNAATITNQKNSATITADTANTANTIVLRDASGNFSAGVMTGTATQARYADLAERYHSDKKYRPGTVVVFGGEFEITQSNKFMDTKVAGVISTNPAHLMNAEVGTDDTHPAVALQGRVPCRVIGKVRKGDMLVTSSIPGVAIAEENPRVGSIIGKALDNYDSDHIGTIEVVIGRT